MDDAELIRLLLAGDGQALRLLLERHAPVVRAVCRRRLADPALADDAAQAVFVVLATKAGSIREPRALAAWLHRTALNACDHVQRSETRRHAHERIAGAAMARELAMSEAPTDSTPAWDEIRPHLDAAVDALPPSQRAAVIGFYLHGKPQRELASELGCSEAAVKMRLQASLERLRTLLARRGVSIGALALAACLAGPARAAEDPGFIAACLDAAQGQATPATQAIAKHLLHATSAKAMALTAAALLALGTGLTATAVLVHTLWPPPSSNSAPATPTPPQPAIDTKDDSMKLMLPIATVLIAASSAPAQDVSPTPPVTVTAPAGGANWAPGQNGANVGIGRLPGTMVAGWTNRSGSPDLSREVELVTLSTGNDAAGLARWGELAAEGFQVAGVVNKGELVLIFLQRDVFRNLPNQPITLPALVEADKALADGVRKHVAEWQAARQRAAAEALSQMMEERKRHAEDANRPGQNGVTQPDATRPNPPVQGQAAPTGF